jgi:YD repeat-containing protein
MKKLIYIFAICGAMFTACGKNPDDTNDPDNSKNYWERSALVHQQLKGKVKSVQVVGGSLANFDQSGRITSITSYWGDDPAVTNYTYNAAGQLISVVDGYSTSSYTYGTHGKYIPTFRFHWPEMGPLMLNLTSTTTGYGYSVNYVFSGDKLLEINSWENEGVISKDTNIIDYQGKYPQGYETIYEGGYGEFVNATYFENGMFRVYSEGFIRTDGRDTRKWTYKTDNEYMLIDTREFSNPDNYSKAVYTYDDKKNVTKIVETSGTDVYTTEYTYEYDSHGNWTKKTEKYSYGTDVNEYVTERVITYW